MGEWVAIAQIKASTSVSKERCRRQEGLFIKGDDLGAGEDYLGFGAARGGREGAVLYHHGACGGETRSRPPYVVHGVKGARTVGAKGDSFIAMSGGWKGLSAEWWEVSHRFHSPIIVSRRPRWSTDGGEGRMTTSSDPARVPNVTCGGELLAAVPAAAGRDGIS